MMDMEDNGNCGSSLYDDTSSATASPPPSRSPPAQSRKLPAGKKFDVYNEILRRLRHSSSEEAMRPGFDEELWNHFNRLPTRYALDVNVERAEDVLMHKTLLQLAHDPDNRPGIKVRLVEVFRCPCCASNMTKNTVFSWERKVLTHNSLRLLFSGFFSWRKKLPHCNSYAAAGKSQIRNLLLVSPTSEVHSIDSVHSGSLTEDASQSSQTYQSQKSIHPPTAFGSSPNLEALALEVSESFATDGGSSVDDNTHLSWPMHEITFSTVDKPKLLSQLTRLLSEVGLNIQEAHAFSTTDGYSLDVFVVDGWPYQETDKLATVLEKEVLKSEKQAWLDLSIPSPITDEQTGMNVEVDNVLIPDDGSDVWEIDVNHLKFDGKVATGSYGDLYKGTYCSQDVAIKVLKPERLNSDLQREFAQEVFIMRKVRHRNVVQFIGACTKPPSLCIVTEFMSGGSIYDYLHKQKGVFKLPRLLKVAIDVSKGMSYLHQNNIIHRDLKAPNILLDENEVAKVADFGVARVKAQSGVMTAETGTYRWMAPEVIEHKPYDHKADVFSFGIVLWELLTGKLPYDYLTPLQAAVAVVQKGLRPAIPKNTHPKLMELLNRCWQQDPTLRPDFSEIILMLQQIAKEVRDEGKFPRKEKSGRFLSVLRRGL